MIEQDAIGGFSCVVALRPDAHVLAGLARSVEAGLRPTVREVFDLADAQAAHQRLVAGGAGGKVALTTSPAHARADGERGRRTGHRVAADGAKVTCRPGRQGRAAGPGRPPSRSARRRR